MMMLRNSLAALPILMTAGSAVALDRVLPTPRIKDNGDVRLSDDLRLGRFQGNKFISTPDALQLQGLGSTGRVDDMTIQRESLANVIKLQQKLAESISIAEYASPGTNNIPADACAKIAARSKFEGRSIFVPGAIWTFYCDLSIDRSAESGYNPSALRTSVYGQGSGTTIWLARGPLGKALSIKGGSTGTGQESNQVVQGITFSGTNADGTAGLSFDHTAWMGITDVQVTGFDKGIDGIDVEWFRAYRASIRFNKRGVTMVSRANTQQVEATSSDPNGHSWTASTIANNSVYGLDYLRPSSLGFYGTGIHDNGAAGAAAQNPNGTNPSFGLRVRDACTQGGVGLDMHGGYNEANYGVADIWLTQLNPTFVANNGCVYNITGTGFMKPRDGTAANYIATQFLAESSKQSLRVMAAFKTANGVVTTAPAVGFIGPMQRKDIDLDLSGSVFVPGTEVDEYFSYAPTVTGGAGFSASATMRVSQHWKTAKVMGQAVVTNFGTSGAKDFSISLPYQVRTGQTVPCSAVNYMTGELYLNGAVGGTSTLSITTTQLTPQTINFSCEYPVN